MSSYLRALPLLLSLPAFASLGVVACASTDGESEPGAAAAESDLSGSAVLTLGSISKGQKLNAAYNKTPKWRAFSFTASKDDQVDFWVRSTVGGDAEAFIVTAQYATLASNTSADGVTKDARVKTTIPKTGNYYIVFRDSDAKATSFDVEFVKPAVVVADAGAPADSGTVDSGPPPVMSDDPFDQTSCLGTPMTYAQALALANAGDSSEHSQKPKRLGRYALKTHRRSCDADGNNCGPWTPTVDAKFDGGYLGLGYAGNPFTLQGGVRIDKEGGIRIRVVDDSVDSSPMFYPQSVAMQLSEPAGGVGPAKSFAYNDYQFGATDVNDSRKFLYGTKTAVWSTIVLTNTCLRMMSTAALTHRDPGDQVQYALVARF